MSSSEVTAYLAAVKWGDEGHYLKEFTTKLKLPQAAKIIKGQYQQLGVPTLPSPGLQSVVFLASAGAKLKVIAQCVKFKDAGRRMVPVGNKLAVPENYDGWFEILSEDGRTVRCIESVAELARRNPKSCLVRDSMKVYLPRPDDSEAVWDKTRTISPGEILTVGELVTGNSAKASRNGNSKYLSCTTSFGDTIFLPLDLRSRFSTIAGEDNISGVHTVKTLMSKRFPLMVRLVHGKPPVGVKIGSQFVNEMRLYSLIEEECLVAMPLGSKDASVVPLPLNAPLKVLAPKNLDVLAKMPEHSTIANKCHSLMAEVSGCIQTCDVSAIREIKNLPLRLDSSSYVHHHNKSPDTYRSVPLVRRSASDPQGTNSSGRVHIERGMSTPNESSLPVNDDDEPDDCSDSDDLRYDEIDQIYDYVRGFAPLPANIRNEFSEEHKSQLLPQIVNGKSSGSSERNKPPEPPPIETIPVRKLSTGTVKQPHKITVSIVNRTPSFGKTKEIFIPPHRMNHHQKSKKVVEDHIYEKIENKRKNSGGGLKLVKVFETNQGGGRGAPLRSNSASKIFQQNGVVQNANLQCDNNNNNKMPYKRQTQYQLQVNHSQNNGKSRFLKNNKNSYVHKDISAINRKSQKSSWVNSGVKTIATSPLFHIRYKSLTDLLMDTKKSTPESSNTSSDNNNKKMDGSAGSSSTVSSSKDDNNEADDFSSDVEQLQQQKTNGRRLSRPKSLSNLVGGEERTTPKRRGVDNHNYYNLVQNDLIKPPPPELLNCPKFYSMPDSTARYNAKNHFGNSHHAKKLGTLYL